MNINMRKKTALALGSALMSWLRGFEELFQKEASGAGLDLKSSGRIFLTGGLTAGYAFHENVGVGVEVLYAGLGGELEISKKLPATASDAEKKANKPMGIRMHSHNLVIPVMVKLFPMGCDPDKGILTVDLGVQAAMPLSTALEGKRNGDKDKFEAKEIDESKIFNPFSMDAIFGIGYEFPEIGLTLEGRYNLGLMDLFKNDADAKTYKEDKLDGMANDKNVKNHYVTLSLGYNFARLLMD
jgi:Outer membrane protein beta-barrel domain